MNVYVQSLLAMIIFGTSGVFGQIDQNVPQIGYLYPAGARQGTTVYVTAGGQLLRGAKKVYISGDGIEAMVVDFIRSPANLNKEQREFFTNKLKQVRNRRIAELPASVKAEMFTKKQLEKMQAETADMPDDSDVDPKVKRILNHPLFRDLENKSLRELANIREMLFMPRYKKQLNRQISELVLLKIDLKPDAKPGMRELRISAAGGLTNPVRFEVGTSPEVMELEPNNRDAFQDPPGLKNLPKGKPCELPVVLNGQIMPGDVDRFRFRAESGWHIVVRVQARNLIPYLADTVPGWFQATVSLYNAAGTEVAYNDDFRFHPDPILYYEIPRNGEYELEIRDAIYRGREDFVYRISVGQTPFITQMFPLGVRAGSTVSAAVDGWNLPAKTIELKATSAEPPLYETYLDEDGVISNSVPFEVDTLPERNENISNNDMKSAEKVDIPLIVNGRIEKSGDVDVFRIEGKAGETIVAEVYARRLNSPLDSLLRLTDANGNVLALNDDHMVVENQLHLDEVGVMTHHADSYLTAAFPKTGPCYLFLSDSQDHGGPAYGYRLRISPPRPDFQLRATPAGLGMKVGTILPITVYALRKDGFNGDIEVVVKDPATGFKIHGGLIPAGCDKIRMTLEAPPKAPKEPVNLQLGGRAVVNEQTLRRAVVATEDRMQAFLYRHLVPAGAFMVEVRPNRWTPPPINLASTGPVKLPLGQSVQVLLKTRKRPVLKEMDLQLYDPPAGISIENVSIVPEGFSMQLKAAPDAAEPGLRDNLIVEAFREFTPASTDKIPNPKKRRNFIGVIPAIPIQVVSSEPTKHQSEKTIASIEEEI
jgi:hypothetical protein